MFFLLASAVGAGLTATILAIPLSPLLALVAGPIVGSTAALAAGLYLTWRRSPNWSSEEHIDRQTDAMVSALRHVAQQGQTVAGRTTVPSVKLTKVA